MRIPDDLRSQFISRHGGRRFTVALKLNDGSEVEDVRVDELGTIVGLLFHPELNNEERLGFSAEQIVAVRSVLSPWYTRGRRAE